MDSGVNRPEQADGWVLVQPGLFTYPVPKDGIPALMANQCRTCSSVFFPKRAVCPTCFTQGELVDRTISGRGTVYTSSIVHIPSPTGIRPPYACGYVDMPIEGNAGKARIFALFTGTDPAGISCGKRVDLAIGEIRKDDQGRSVIGYVFRPAGGE